MPDLTARRDQLLSLPEAAQILDLSPATLYAWRANRVGPASIKVGARVKFRESVVMAWIAEREAAEASRG